MKFSLAFFWPVQLFKWYDHCQKITPWLFSVSIRLYGLSFVFRTHVFVPSAVHLTFPAKLEFAIFLLTRNLLLTNMLIHHALQSTIWTSWQILYVLVAALLDQALIKWFTCWMIFLPALPLSEEHRARNTQAFQISMTVRFLLAVACPSFYSETLKPV